MSFPTLRQLLNRLLASFRGFPPHRLINRFFAILSFLRRWARIPNSRRPTLPQCQGSTPSPATLNDGVVYSMNAPSSGPSNTLGHDHHSHMGPPYRSPSGGHLSPDARNSRDAPGVLYGTSMHDEPNPTSPNAPHVAAGSLTHTDSTTNVCGFRHDYTPNILSSSSTPHHRTIDVTGETSSLPSRPSSRQSFVSRTSRCSGRASYREHRVQTPDQNLSVLGSSSSPTLRRGGLSEVIAPACTTAPPNASNASLGGCRFFPMPVSDALRYEHRKTRPPSECNHKVEAMFYDYPEAPEVPDGWSAHRHPEGALYFVHDKSKTFTEVDICDTEVHDDVEYFRTYLRSVLKAVNPGPNQTESFNINEVPMLQAENPGPNQTESFNVDEVPVLQAENPESDQTESFNVDEVPVLQAGNAEPNQSKSFNIDEVQLVLEPRRDGLYTVCYYYFVNPRTRAVFWLDEWVATDIFKDCRGSLSIPHKGLGIREQYWCVIRVWDTLIISDDLRHHWSLYPNFCAVTKELKDEVESVVLHAICEHLTSRKSTSPLNAKELKSRLSLIKKVDPEKTDQHGHYAIIIGRIMREFHHAYFIHFHGEDCARLDLDQTIYGWRYHPSLLMSTVAPLLFMTPVHNVRQLHKIYVDDIVNRETWDKFVDKLNTELQETSVLATVLLNANVAFLQVLGSGSSAQQFLTYTSLVTSMASIILGLVFMGHRRTGARSTPSEAAIFLNRMWHKKHGLENLAIIYSLPYSFLLWGMILFFAAFSTQWFHLGHMAWCAIAGAFILKTMLLLAWCIWTTQDRCHYWWFQPDPKVKIEEVEGEGGDDATSSRIAASGSGHLLRRLTTSLFRTRATPQESYPMQVIVTPTGVATPSPTLTQASHRHLGPHAK